MSCTPVWTPSLPCYSLWTPGCQDCSSLAIPVPVEVEKPNFTGIIGYSTVLGVPCYSSFTPGCGSFAEGAGYETYVESIVETYAGKWYDPSETVADLVDKYTSPYMTYWSPTDGYVGPYAGYSGSQYVDANGNWNGNMGGYDDQYVRQFVDPENGYRWTGNYPYRTNVQAILDSISGDRRLQGYSNGYLDSIFSVYKNPVTTTEFVDEVSSLGLEVAEVAFEENLDAYVEDGEWTGHINENIDLDSYLNIGVDAAGYWTGWAGRFTGGYNPQTWDWDATLGQWNVFKNTPEKRQSKVMGYLKKIGVVGLTPTEVAKMSAGSLAKRYAPKTFFKTLRYMKEEDLTQSEYLAKVTDYYQTYASVGNILELARKYEETDYVAFATSMYENWTPKEVIKRVGKYTPLKGDELDEFVKTVVNDYNPIKLDNLLTDLGLSHELNNLIGDYVEEAQGYVSNLPVLSASMEETSSDNTAVVAAAAGAGGAAVVGAALFAYQKKTMNKLMQEDKLEMTSGNPGYV